MTTKTSEPESRDSHSDPERRCLETLGQAAGADYELLCDPVSLGLFATDASMYQIWPLAVVYPRSRNGLIRAQRIVAAHGLPILPRGAGTSVAGQTVGRAVVFDASRHLRRILEVNAAERWVRVEPGLVRDELNAALAPEGLHFAPDPATGNRATIGGMIATNSAGMRSVRHGMTIDHVLEVELLLSTGEVLKLGPLNGVEWEAKCALPDREGEIYRRFREIVQAHRDEILARFPRVRRHSGGYPLNHFTEPMPWNLARLVAGSEGSLGTVLEAKLNLEPLPAHSGLCLAQFRDVDEALRANIPLATLRPSAVELLDGDIVRSAIDSTASREAARLITGEPGAVLVIEMQDEDKATLARRLEAIEPMLRARGLGTAFPLALEPADRALIWQLRKNGLGPLTAARPDAMPIAFIEDSALPLEELPEFIREVTELCHRHGHDVAHYGHSSVGVIHVRPMLDLHRTEDVAQLREIQEQCFELVVRHGGAWSGEHGDGILRGAYQKRFFGEALYEAFREIKALFDPPGLMNPGKVVDSPPVTEHLRYAPGYSAGTVDNRFHYRREGGFLAAVEKCTGVGACRKSGEGTMCPSYMATRNEEHSTRGRANALRLAMTGQFPGEGLDSERLRQVMDLCLSCKACLAECPNNVDMSRLKSEVEFAHHQKHGPSLRSRLFASSPRSARLAAGMLAHPANAVNALPPVRAAMDRYLGIDRRRPLPRYSPLRMSRWYRRHRTPRLDAPVVGLFNDTYIECYEPQIGIAAVEMLEALGYRVLLLDYGDSQRTAISKGFLDVARREGERLFRRLDNSDSEMPILVCEPSDATALATDVPDLLEDSALAESVARRVRHADAFIAEALGDPQWSLPFKQPAGGDSTIEILFHGHCHQKASVGTAGSLDLLRAIPGAQVRELDTGCCGMAGSFGYEREHYDLSMQIGEDRLFPALRKASPGAHIVANGFSCRHQVRDALRLDAMHCLEVVRKYLK